jgi:predicted RNA-binding Zn-ribbon protein involved in translation (DUF1610 family)
MNETCSKCSARLESSWKFCPHCGAVSAREATATTQLHLDHENAPVKSGFSGLVLGFLAAPVLIIYGGMICLTGLGIFLGVPMILAGVCAPLIGSLMGLNALRGKCPWCGANVSGVGLFDRFSCPTCSKRIVVHKHELNRAE